MRNLSPRWMPPLYALMGLIVLVGATMLNHKLEHGEVHWSHSRLPSLVGLALGLWLGLYRKKWMEKEKALNEAGRELDRRMEDADRQARLTRHLQGMLDNTPLPIFLKHRDFRYQLINAPFERLVGRPQSEVIGHTDHEIFPGPVADLFREQDEQVLRDEKGRTFEETIPLAQGVMTFQSFKFPLRDEKGEVYAVGGVSIDISLLKAAQDETARERRKLRAVLDAVDQGIILTRADGRITLMNARAEKTLGETFVQASEKDLNEFALPTNHRIIPLNDRFGQEMGRLVVLDTRVKVKAPWGGAEAEAAPARALRETEPPLPGGTVLVMDDDSLVRRTSRMMLGRLGYEALDAPHGRAAVDIYRAMLAEGNPPDAVIMDLTVPGGMGGVEATSAILAMDPEARIMVASGYSKDPVLANYREYGFLARVEKPFSSDKLREALCQTLDI